MSLTTEEIMAAITEPVYERLTGNRDDLAADLKGVVVRFYGIGYEHGVKRGAQALRDAVIERANKGPLLGSDRRSEPPDDSDRE